MEQTDSVGKQENMNGKDKVAITSLILGLLSIPFTFVGVIPLTAIILGAWGIVRTKAEGSGRWMAVTGLILGVVFLLANAYANGHLEFLTQNTKTDTPTLQQTTDVSTRLIDMQATSTDIHTEVFEISAEVTNISDKPMRAVKGTVYVEDVFGEYVIGIKFVRTDPLQPGEKFIVSEVVGNFHSNDDRLDGYQDLVEAGNIDNLKTELLIEEIVY